MLSAVPVSAAPKKCLLPALHSCQHTSDCDEISTCMEFDNPCVAAPETVRFCVSRQMASEGRCYLFEEPDGSQSVRCKRPPPAR